MRERVVEKERERERQGDGKLFLHVELRIRWIKKVFVLSHKSGVIRFLDLPIKMMI